MTKFSKNFPLIFLSFIAFLALGWLANSWVQDKRQKYNAEIEKPFMDQMLSLSKNEGNAFLISRITDFQWDQVCILSSLGDTSYQEWPIHSFIRYKKFQPSHWTEWYPEIYPMDAALQLIGLNLLSEYSTAFVFVKDNMVVRVIRTFRGSFDMGFEAACHKDFLLTVKRHRHGKETYIYIDTLQQ